MPGAVLTPARCHSRGGGRGVLNYRDLCTSTSLAGAPGCCRRCHKSSKNYNLHASSEPSCSAKWQRKVKAVSKMEATQLWKPKWEENWQRQVDAQTLPCRHWSLSQEHRLLFWSRVELWKPGTNPLLSCKLSESGYPKLQVALLLAYPR